LKVSFLGAVAVSLAAAVVVDWWVKGTFQRM